MREDIKMSNIHRPEEQDREEEISGFDFRTHVMSKKTKSLAKVQNYHINYKKGGGSLIERPIGSGQWFSEDGKLVRQDAEIKPEQGDGV